MCPDDFMYKRKCIMAKNDYLTLTVRESVRKTQ